MGYTDLWMRNSSKKHTAPGCCTAVRAVHTSMFPMAIVVCTVCGVIQTSMQVNEGHFVVLWKRCCTACEVVQHLLFIRTGSIPGTSTITFFLQIEYLIV